MRTIDHLPVLPARAPDAHKGDFGHVLVVAGSPGMTGAACMTADAAQRAGAGLVTLALPEGLNLAAEVKLTSVMSMPLPQTGSGALGLKAGVRVLECADRFDLIAIGPGLGREEETFRMVTSLVGKLEPPLVIDADALNALAGETQALKQRKSATVLTPHPGEMMRLAGLSSVEDVQSNRCGEASRFAKEHNVVLALKGHGTVVTDGERLYVNPTGNPGMAAGGTGDVLTGLVAGLLCQPLDTFGAVQTAVFVHGLAGDLAASDKGQLSLTAEDLFDQVPRAFQILSGAAARAVGGELPLSAVRQDLNRMGMDFGGAPSPNRNQ